VFEQRLILWCGTFLVFAILARLYRTGERDSWPHADACGAWTCGLLVLGLAVWSLT